MKSFLIFTVVSFLSGCGFPGLNPFNKGSSEGESSANVNSPTGGALTCGGTNITLDIERRVPSSYKCQITGYADPNSSAPFIKLYKRGSSALCTFDTAGGGENNREPGTEVSAGNYEISFDRLRMPDGQTTCAFRAQVENSEGLIPSGIGNSYMYSVTVKGTLPSAVAESVVTVVTPPRSTTEVVPSQQIQLAKFAVTGGSPTATTEILCVLKEAPTRTGTTSAQQNACPSNLVNIAEATETVNAVPNIRTLSVNWTSPSIHPGGYFWFGLSVRYTSGTLVTTSPIKWSGYINMKTECAKGSYFNTTTNLCTPVSCPLFATPDQSGQCVCASGYRLNGGVCKLLAKNEPCPANSARIGSSATCTCSSGYTSVNGACVQSCPVDAIRLANGSCACTDSSKTISGTGLTCEAALTASILVERTPMIVGPETAPTTELFTFSAVGGALSLGLDVSSGDCSNPSVLPYFTTPNDGSVIVSDFGSPPSGTYKACVRVTDAQNTTSTATSVATLTYDLTTYSVQASMNSLYINQSNSTSTGPFITITVTPDP